MGLKIHSIHMNRHNNQKSLLFSSSLSYYHMCIRDRFPCSSSLLGGTVEGEAVGGAVGGALDAGLGELLDAVADSVGGDTLKSDQVGAEASNVGRGHGGTRHGFVSTTGDGRDDLVTRGVDVDCRRIRYMNQDKALNRSITYQLYRSWTIQVGSRSHQ